MKWKKIMKISINKTAGNTHLDGSVLVDSWSEIVRITTESYAEQLQESVHAVEESFRGVSGCVDGWTSFEDNHTISEVSCHDEIVLDDEASFFGVKNVAAEENSLINR